MIYDVTVFGGLLLVGGGALLFMDSMTKMESRRGSKQGAELTDRGKEITAKAEVQELQMSVDNKLRSSGSSSEPIMFPHASILELRVFIIIPPRHLEQIFQGQGARCLQFSVECL